MVRRGDRQSERRRVLRYRVLRSGFGSARPRVFPLEVRPLNTRLDVNLIYARIWATVVGAGMPATVLHPYVCYFIEKHAAPLTPGRKAGAAATGKLKRERFFTSAFVSQTVRADFPLVSLVGADDLLLVENRLPK